MRADCSRADTDVSSRLSRRARGLTALQPARDADKRAQLWAHRAARNQIWVPLSSQTNRITAPPLLAERLFAARTHARTLSTQVDHLSGLTSGSMAPSKRVRGHVPRM